jgi:hypothetical protein
MKKITYNDNNALKAKDFENKLWEVFWSYPQELRLDDPQVKQEKMRRADFLIPELAAMFVEFDLYFDYPLVYILLTSLHLDKNILKTEDAQRIMSFEDGPDNNSKLVYFVSCLQEKGIVWQQKPQQ